MFDSGMVLCNAYGSMLAAHSPRVDGALLQSLGRLPQEDGICSFQRTTPESGKVTAGKETGIKNHCHVMRNVEAKKFPALSGKTLSMGAASPVDGVFFLEVFMKWFKHDTDAAADAKVRKLVLKYGAIGYAVYFHCLELIAGEVSKTNLTFELEHDAEIIADNLKIQGTQDLSAVDLVQEIMRFCVDQQLFQESAGRIFCFKLLNRLDASMTSSPEMRKLIAVAKQNHDTVMIGSGKGHDNVMQEVEVEVEVEVDKKKKRTRPARKPSVALPEWIDPSSWEAFVQMRKAIKAPLTERAMEMALNKLSLLKTKGEDVNAVLDQSTMNCWKGLFPLKTDERSRGALRTFGEQRVSNTRKAVEDFAHGR